MGLDLFLPQGFAVTDARDLQDLQATASWPDRYPQLFKGLGRMSGFLHQPTFLVSPVIQPLRCIPLALRYETVDASPWVSNLVIAKKKGGGLCLCVDLTDPLPTAEELTSHFHGSTV